MLDMLLGFELGLGKLRDDERGACVDMVKAMNPFGYERNNEWSPIIGGHLFLDAQQPPYSPRDSYILDSAYDD